jgi:hypothetical protein
MQRERLEAKLNDDRPVPNMWLRTDGDGHSLALFLPGYGYTSVGPVLRYPLLWFTEHGIDTLTVDYSFDHLAQGADAGEHAFQSAAAVLSAVMHEHRYTRLVLVGKSLGTPAMARLMLERDVQPAACVWLTPILSNRQVVEAAARPVPKSLYIIGTADSLYDESVLQAVIDASKGHALVVENANHSLEIEGDVRATLAVASRLLGAIEACLADI